VVRRAAPTWNWEYGPAEWSGRASEFVVLVLEDRGVSLGKGYNKPVILRQCKQLSNHVAPQMSGRGLEVGMPCLLCLSSY